MKGFKESLGVKFKDELRLKLGLKAIGIFVILLSRVGFESDCPETKVRTIISWSQLKKVIVHNSNAELWGVISSVIRQKG